MNLKKSLIKFSLSVVIFQFISWGLWYMIGWQWDENHWEGFNWLIFIISGFVFPIWFSNVIARIKPRVVNWGWITKAFLTCWLLLLANAVLDRIVATYASGFYAAEVKPVIGNELWVGNYFILFLQWIWITLLFCIAFFDLNQMRDKVH